MLHFEQISGIHYDILSFNYSQYPKARRMKNEEQNLQEEETGLNEESGKHCKKLGHAKSNKTTTF